MRYHRPSRRPAALHFAMINTSPQTDAPKVSVVIPCFNLGQYLDEAVESVLQQHFGDFEIIVINDGSTDPATNALLASYVRPKTRVMSTENRGLARARNLGISMSRGQYVCTLDADDKLHPAHLERTVRVLDENPALSFASMWLQAFGGEDWIWKQERCDLPTLLGECTVCTAALMRASALRAVGGFDEGMPDQGYEDWDLWITLVASGYEGTIIPEVLFYYRRRAGSMSSICCFGEPHQRLTRYLVEKHRDSYDRHMIDVLLRKERDLSEVLRTNLETERHIQTSLVPEVNRRREELASLDQKLLRAEEERALRLDRDQLAARVAELESAIVKVFGSTSWKLTAPLRAVYDAFHRVMDGKE